MKLKGLISEKNVPTNPSLWAKFVAQAKKKFDVYPSAYANGWASKQYKDAGGKWKTEETHTPQHVAVALPQTKEVDGKKIGERFMEYLQDNGLKHAAYQNEEGNVKIVGLNKEQVKEALKDIVKEYNDKINEEPAKDNAEKIRNYNQRIDKLKKALSATKSSNQKNQLQTRLKTVLQNLSNLKKSMGVKREGFPGGAGVGISLPGGYINGAPSEDDVKKMKKNLKK